MTRKTTTKLAIRAIVRLIIGPNEMWIKPIVSSLSSFLFSRLVYLMNCRFLWETLRSHPSKTSLFGFRDFFNSTYAVGGTNPNLCLDEILGRSNKVHKNLTPDDGTWERRTSFAKRIIKSSFPSSIPQFSSRIFATKRTTFPLITRLLRNIANSGTNCGVGKHISISCCWSSSCLAAAAASALIIRRRTRQLMRFLGFIILHFLQIPIVSWGLRRHYYTTTCVHSIVVNSLLLHAVSAAAAAADFFSKAIIINSRKNSSRRRN